MPIFPRDTRHQNDKDGDDATKKELEKIMRLIQSHIKQTARESSKRFLSQFGL